MWMREDLHILQSKLKLTSYYFLLLLITSSRKELNKIWLYFNQSIIIKVIKTIWDIVIN